MRRWESDCLAPTALGLGTHTTMPGFLFGCQGSEIMFVKQTIIRLAISSVWDHALLVGRMIIAGWLTDESGNVQRLGVQDKKCGICD